MRVCQRLSSLGDDSALHLAPADRSNHPTVAVHQHLAPGVPRHSATRLDDRRQRHRLARPLSLGQLLKQPPLSHNALS
jgi:hypothetical protein